MARNQKNNTKPVCQIKVGTNTINAISLSKDNRVVVAGRSLLKIFNFNEADKEFTETVNLQGGRREQGLNMSSADVAWSELQENILATGATNGAVIAWDLNMQNRNKQYAIFNEHSRSVSKISFHPGDHNILLSGSQDGSMKLFDVRRKMCLATFYGRADGIRCVQFSPNANSNCQFASSMDNGYVQIWDTRKPNCYVKEFIAHKGSVYTLDWHPDPEEKGILVTGGRDKTVKVWDTNTDGCDKTKEIPAGAVVSTVKWRPRHKQQLATAYMIMDYDINLWDLRRVHVPYAQFQDHTELTAGLAWKRNDPQSLYSCSKDGTLVLHSVERAKFSADVLKAGGVSHNQHGYVVVAGNQAPTPAPSSRSSSPIEDKVVQPQPRRLALLNRFNSGKSSDDDQGLHISSSPNASTFSIGGQVAICNEKTPITTSSTPGGRTVSTVENDNKLRDFLSWNSKLTVYKAKYPLMPCMDMNDYQTEAEILSEALTMNGFDHAAINYVIDGADRKGHTLMQVCQINKEVALKAGKPIEARTWLLLGHFYNADASMVNQLPAGSRPASIHGGGMLSRTHSDAAYIERTKRASGDKESKRSSLHKDELTGSQTLFANMAGDGVGESDFSLEQRFRPEESIMEIAHSRPNVDELYWDNMIDTEVENESESENWDVICVPSEAFDTKQDIGMDDLTTLMESNPPPPVTLRNNRQVSPKQLHLNVKGTVKRDQDDIDDLPPVCNQQSHHYSSSISSSEELEQYVNGMSMDIHLSKIEPHQSVDPFHTIRDVTMKEQLTYFAEHGMVQTAVSMILLLQSYSDSISLLKKIPTWRMESWQQVYIDLLFARRLYVQRAKVIKMSKIPSIQALSHSSTHHLRSENQRISLKKGTISCGKTRNGSHERHKFVLCAICQLPVRGMILFCQTCSLSGHPDCIKSWVSHLKEQGCAGGCNEHSL